MDYPGEKLLIKMWESLVEGGIGKLLTPWQKQREANAQLESRRREMLVIAQTEKDVDEIRAGKKTVIVSGHHSVKLLPSSGDVTAIEGRIEPTLILEDVAHIASEFQELNAIREELNITKTILHAESILRDDSAEPAEQAIDRDWLYRWRDNASQVSNDELQSLWAKVLAGEVKSPGSCSLRTMDFLRSLSKTEAEEIQRLCPYVVDNNHIFVYGTMKPSSDIAFQMRMQELGILSGVEAALTLTFRNAHEHSKIAAVFNTKSRYIIATKANDQLTALVLRMYRVTALGSEVLKLNPMPAPEEYLQAILAEIKQQGYGASIGEFVNTSGTLSV